MICKWCKSEEFEPDIYEFEDEQVQGHTCKFCGSFISDDGDLIPHFKEDAKCENFAGFTKTD